MSKKKKILIIGAVVVVVLALVFANMNINTSTGLEVKAETAKARELVEQVSASGRIQPQTKVNITSEVNGEIISLAVKEGDYVKTGDLLVVLDTVQLKSTVDQALYAMNEIEARLSGSKVSMEQAKEEYDRQEKLLKTNSTSQKVYDDAKYAAMNAEAAYKASLAQEKQYKARLEQAEDNYSKAKIRAPMSGIITYLDCEVGEIAPAQTVYSQGKTLMTISNLDVFEVEVEVDETEINKVELGQDADIEVDAFPDTVFSGRIIEIGNTALYSSTSGTDQSTNFSVKVIFEDKNIQIRPGMSATVDIITNKESSALSVPYSAIVMRSYDPDSLEQAKSGDLAQADDSNGASMVNSVQAAENDENDKDEMNDDDEIKREEFKGVFVIRDGKAKFVQVETGIADQKYIEVVEGLQEGDSVISGPYRILRTIKDEQNVKLSDKKENN